MLCNNLQSNKPAGFQELVPEEIPSIYTSKDISISIYTQRAMAIKKSIERNEK